MDDRDVFCLRRVLAILLVCVVAEAPCVLAREGTADQKCEEKGLRCCLYTMFSPEYMKCTREIGCYPSCFKQATVPTITYETNAPNVSVAGRECGRGLICCRFATNTPEFVQCCEEHRCRPACDQVTRGCCYNGRVWAWGTTVDVVEEACVNIVCAAVQTAQPPYISARLVPVRRSGPDCAEGVCEDCQLLGCVDKTGMMREEGEEFNVDECHRCKCLAGGRVKCWEVVVQCPHLPVPLTRYCQEVQGPCCKYLNCSLERTCRDTNNQVHSLYSTWKSDPCTTHQCTLAGITATRKDCPPRPHPNCVRKGEMDEEKSSFREGEKDKDECCPDWVCGPDCRLVKCSQVPPGEDCREISEPLACCPKWNCSGCLDVHNDYHPMGREWHPTPCTSLTCTPLGIVNTTAPCKPKPHEVCTEDHTRKGCCPAYNCGGCVDKWKKFRPMFSKWEVAPCSFLTCTPRGIVTVKPECSPKPHGNCFEGPLNENCCPQWECGPDCRLVRCAGPPGKSCTPYVPPLSCCPQWNCSNVCVDEAGRRQPAGSVWRTDDPCTNKTCTESGEVISVTVDCPVSEPPRRGCFQYTPKGECCPKWNCSGCRDDQGAFHSLYQAWNTDTCTSHFCQPSGILTHVIQCPTLGPMPQPNCVKKVVPGQCCPEWVCGPNCSLVLCAPPPRGYCTEHKQPLACCSQWTCSGCPDHEGRQRKIGEIWYRAPCSLHTCTEQGVATKNLCDIQYTQGRIRRRAEGYEYEPMDEPIEHERAETPDSESPDSLPVAA